MRIKKAPACRVAKALTPVSSGVETRHLREARCLRVLFLPNWPIAREGFSSDAYQSPDRLVPGQPYWFFRHFSHEVMVDVLDIVQWRLYRWEDRCLHFYLAQGVRAAMAAQDYDLLLAHGAQSGVVACSLVGLMPRRPKLMVIDVGCLNGGRPERRMQFQATRVGLRSCDAIVWHARSSRELCLSACPELASKGRFVPFGIDIDDLAEVEKADGDYAICAGYSCRDWRLLFDAWEIVDADRQLILLGAGGKVNPPRGNITATPKIPFRQYLEAVAKSRLVVLPLPDGWSSWGQMTLLQCMGLGKPVVVTNVKPVRDYIACGCRQVESDDPYGLAAAIDELWDDGQVRAELGANAAATVRQRFSEAEMAATLERMIGSVAGAW